MEQTKQLIHIVADFGTGNDTCAQAIACHNLLFPLAEIRCWTTGTRPNLSRLAIPPRRISAFGGDYPVGGTLLIFGSCQPLSPWIERSSAGRIVVYTDSFDGDSLFRLLVSLRHAPLPEPDLAFSCRHLADTLGVRGRVVPPLVTVPETVPDTAPARTNPRPVVVMPLPRADDASLGKSWALAGVDVKILGSATDADPSLRREGIRFLPSPFPVQPSDLSAADILYLPAGPDGAPLPPRILACAMAAGAAVVARGTGGLEEWIADGETALLAGSADQAWDKVMTLAHDPELRNRLGRGARTRAGDLSGTQARSALAVWLLPPVSA